MAKTENKVNLELLKRLVSEFETAIDSVEHVNESDGDVKDLIVELSKAYGLGSGVVKEASLLMADLQTIINMLSSSFPKEKSTSKDPFSEALLSALKGTGNTN